MHRVRRVRADPANSRVRATAAAGLQEPPSNLELFLHSFRRKANQFPKKNSPWNVGRRFGTGLSHNLPESDCPAVAALLESAFDGSRPVASLAAIGDDGTQPVRKRPGRAQGCR